MCQPVFLVSFFYISYEVLSPSDIEMLNQRDAWFFSDRHLPPYDMESLYFVIGHVNYCESGDNKTIEWFSFACMLWFVRNALPSFREKPFVLVMVQSHGLCGAVCVPKMGGSWEISTPM